MQCITLTTIIMCNILQTVYFGMPNHLMDRVISFVEEHSKIGKFNQCWAMMSPYTCFTWFNHPYRPVTQKNAQDMNTLRHIIFSIFFVTDLNPLATQRIPFTEALLCVKNALNFHCIAEYKYHTKPVDRVHWEVSGGVSLSHQLFQSSQG